jgi:hypothetical protein
MALLTPPPPEENNDKFKLNKFLKETIGIEAPILPPELLKFKMDMEAKLEEEGIVIQGTSSTFLPSFMPLLVEEHICPILKPRGLRVQQIDWRGDKIAIVRVEDPRTKFEPGDPIYYISVNFIEFKSKVYILLNYDNVVVEKLIIDIEQVNREN